MRRRRRTWRRELRLFVLLYVLGLFWPLVLLPFADGAEAEEYLRQFTGGAAVWLFGLLPYATVQLGRGAWSLIRRLCRRLGG